jgi:hypothetical protein
MNETPPFRGISSAKLRVWANCRGSRLQRVLKRIAFPILKCRGSNPAAPATQSCLRGCAGSCRLLLGSRDIYGRMSREPRSLTLTHRQLWKQCLLPVTCVIGRHHLYELVISTRTRGTGGRCGEQPKDMKYFSGRMAPRGRGAARLGTEPRRYCRGCFTAFFLNSANREADLQRCEESQKFLSRLVITGTTEEGELKMFEGVVQSIQDNGDNAPSGRRWRVTMMDES